MIRELFTIIEDRKRNPIKDSYTNSLFESGQDRIVQKFGEEAVEVIISATNQGNDRLVEETADLIYHLLVLLAYKDISLADIEKELKARHEGAKNN
jgi:phosphoribosyl-ATP pyrophosphohydrolase